MNRILLIAAQDIRMNMRNKWILGIGLLFSVLTLSIAYFGMVTSGYVGFQDFRRTGASIISLVLYLMPILSLMMGTYTFTSSKEYLDLMITQPVSRWKIIIGKYLGSLASLMLSTAVGFGLAGIIISIRTGADGSFRFLLIVLLSLLLGAVFLSIAFLLSILLKRRQAAIGSAIVVWFFFVIFYDLLMMSTTVYLAEGSLKATLFTGLLFNPVDMVRVTSLMVVGGSSVFGAAGVVAVQLLGSMEALVALSLTIVTLWVVIPLAATIQIFKRQDVV